MLSSNLILAGRVAVLALLSMAPAPAAFAQSAFLDLTDDQAIARATEQGRVLLLVWTIGLRLWFASDQLHIQRFFDEIYNVPNVRAVPARMYRAPSDPPLSAAHDSASQSSIMRI